MAAYAAVTSLMGTIHLISQSNLDLLEGNKEHLELLYEKVGSLQELLDNSDDEQMKDLQKKIKYLANEVEDEIESYIQRESLNTLPKMLQRATKIFRLPTAQERLFKTFQRATEIFHLPTAHDMLHKMLQRAMEDIDSVKEDVLKLKENNNMRAVLDCSIGGISSPRLHVSTFENVMVGYNIEQEFMRSQLKGYSSQLEVISIAGMGGIGKSTFANKMFYDPSILSFFDVRGWITVSKDYSLRKMILCLLQDAIGVKEELDNVSDGDLADRLQKSLKGRRYLIVVDNIWSTKAWDEIRLCFPENNNRSRILLTTRDMKVAQYASYPKDPFPMRFLEPEESWKLFYQKAFDKKHFPIEFENLAKEVVNNCKGLPLMISVVAGTLSSKSTLDEWTNVAQSVSSLVNLDDYQRCSGVLALSYNHLPSHLKACFLYFGVFPKDRDISMKKLIRLWVAEGLLELKGLEGFEKVAANRLHDLIDKSLVAVSKRSLDGKIKTCRIHDLLHDLCLREAESNGLSYVLNPSISKRRITDCPHGRRWVSVHSKQGCFSPMLFDNLTHSKTRSLLFSSNQINRCYDLGLVHFKLLRVLDLETMRLGLFPSEIVDLVSLRYLAVMVFGIRKDLPISNLWNLQTFIFPQYTPQTGTIYLPNEIWELSQLRHLQSTRMYLCSPPKVPTNEVKYQVLENLLSVSGLSPRCCTKEIFEGIKNVKKLGISGTEDEFDSEPRCLDNLIYLHEVEALNIASYNSFRVDFFLRLPCLSSFPPNLKKLTLCGTSLGWKDMTIISMLPKLEVLKLKDHAFVANMVWEVTEAGFPELKFLLLEELILKYWRAADDFFPCLERVVIKNCSFLQEIPRGFADSMTLELIELHQCSPYLVSFAELIRKEQEDLGNDMLKIYAFDTRDW
ncbi:putative late blight resistance protein homolog R1A-10 [Solanum dulcamara]|uniref:putative late blight resistance protein homolog R1A-10 n=1 Tax=Solanum dulcamara TaxID=45834 RepID=UPI0024864A4E|nr:putative late blight resistance protein homolog R1A-10 [Solanum dulcamara]